MHQKPTYLGNIFTGWDFARMTLNGKGKNAFRVGRSLGFETVGDVRNGFISVKFG